jgi:hypothetical protein
MRSLAKLLTVAACSLSLMAAGAKVPAGTWRLTSEKVIEGDAPAFSPGLVLKLDDSTAVAKFDESGVRGHTDRPLPTSVIGRDRMKTTVSPDGRTLTWDAAGVDVKSGKPYHYLLVWAKQ